MIMPKVMLRLVAGIGTVAAEIHPVITDRVNRDIKNTKDLCDKRMAKKFDGSFGRIKCL